MKHSASFLKLVDDARSRIKETTPEQIKARLDKGEKFVLVDVREENEWKNGHLHGAIHLCKGIIERDIEASVADKDAEVVLYCGGGFRSVLAAENLMKMGYSNISSMDGGWRRWKELGYPVEGS